MPGKRLRLLACLLGCLSFAAANTAGTVHPARATSGRCTEVAIEGDIRAGQSFRHPALADLELRLDPLPSGWVLRIVPAAGPHRAQDFAEMATPPYRSVSPLLVSTDFGFRAQDALGWNPRRFRFAADQRGFAEMQTLRRAVEAGGSAGRQAGAELARRASRQPDGTLRILDARLVPGTADQTPSAAAVAQHFGTTAHQLEQPAGGHASPLGEITWMHFRVELAVPPGSGPARGITAKPAVCGSF